MIVSLRVAAIAGLMAVASTLVMAQTTGAYFIGGFGMTAAHPIASKEIHEHDDYRGNLNWSATNFSALKTVADRLNEASAS